MKMQRTRTLFSFLLGSALVLVALFSTGVAWADPPIRIARLSFLTGTVSFSPAGDDQWAYAVLNRPVISGDRLWSDNGSRVELTLDNGALWLGSATSAVVSNIDDRTTQLQLQQGVLDLRVRRMSSDSVVEIDTPNLAFQVTRPGSYHIEVDAQSATTTVVVRSGAAEVYGQGASYVVAGGQGYRFYGTDLRDSEFFAPRGADEFERFVAERDGRFDRVVSARYVSPEVVGYEDLDRYGSWRPVASYGNVWFPQQVASDWAPYRQGHWSWIDPWGWTWVDDAPWGFAPFHYGRWAYVENRWGWIPGPVNVRPVYAPALVAFVGGANFSISVSSGPAIGWFPLGPREVYRPSYNVSREYYRQVNVSNTVINNTVINNTYVSNVTNTTVPVTQVNYVNMRAPNALTAVAPAAFAQSQPVGRAMVRLPNTAISSAQVQPIAPVAPARAAFTGAAPTAQSRPPALIQQQAIVARTAPPPAPMPVGQQVQMLERNPGKPLDRAEAQPAPGRAAAPAPNVKIVNSGRPTSATPPPAVRGDALRARNAPGGASPAAPPTAPTAVSPQVPGQGNRTTMPTPGAPPAPAAATAPPGQGNRITMPPPGAPPAPPPAAAIPPVPPRGDRTTMPTPGAPPALPASPRPPETRAVTQEPPRPPQQVPPGPPRPPESRAVPQEPPRPVPQGQTVAPPSPAPRQPETRAAPEPARPIPPPPPVARQPERVAPPEPPRPIPQPQPPVSPVPADRAAQPVPPRTVPQAQRPVPQPPPPQLVAPRAPETRAVPQEPPLAPPAAQPQAGRPPEVRAAPPQPAAPPAAAAPARPTPNPDAKREDKKDPDKKD